MVLSNAAKILQLRKLISEREGVCAKGRFASSSLICGIPQGAITEISGTAKIEWVIQFLKDNPNLKVFWAESKFSLLPTALYQRGLDPNRFIFADCGEEVFSTIRKALRCQVFECVVSPNKFREVKLLKSLQLLVEKVNSSLILLSENLQTAWPIALQFEVDREGDFKGFHIKLKKNKTGSDSP